MDMPSRTNSEVSLKPILEKPSPVARQALTEFTELSGGYGHDTVARASRAVGTLQNYAPHSLPQLAYDAAVLLPAAEQIYMPNHPMRQQSAAFVLHDYFTAIERKKSRSYVGTLFGDVPYIDRAASEYTARLDEPSRQVLSGDPTQPVPQEAWLNLRVGANIPNIFETNGITNVESQLAKAAFALDRIVHPDDDDQQLFHNILELETYYKPLLEIYGLHAFDMLLQSRIGRVRVEKSGNEHALEKAELMLDKVKSISPDDILKEVFGRHPESFLFESVKDTVYDESIIYNSTSLAELTGDRYEGVVNSRVKTLGKLALKLLRNPNYKPDGEKQPQPYDVFGMLAVLPDTEQLGLSFATVIEQIQTNDRVTFVTSPSKKNPIYVQGCEKFVREVCSFLPPEVRNGLVQPEEKTVEPNEVFQVAKFTLDVEVGGGQTIPVEVQFQTAADRANARLGDRSHMIHDQGEGMGANIAGTPENLRTIAARRGKIDSNGQYVNPRSIRHGEEFKNAFYDVLENNA